MGLSPRTTTPKRVSNVESGQPNEQLADLAARHREEGVAGGSRHEFAKGFAGPRYNDSPSNRAEGFLCE